MVMAGYIVDAFFILSCTISRFCKTFSYPDISARSEFEAAHFTDVFMQHFFAAHKKHNHSNHMLSATLKSS